MTLFRALALLLCACTLFAAAFAATIAAQVVMAH